MRAAVAAAVVVSALAGPGCRDINDPPRTESRGILALSATPQAELASGASVVVVTAVVDTAVRPPNNEVKFSSSVGILLPGGNTATVAVNDSGFARVQLRAPADSSTAIVTATVGTVTRSVAIPFLPAPATRLQLTPSQFTIASGLANSIDVTATLLRSLGTPTPGSLVAFSADTVGGTGGTFGRFSPAVALASSPSVKTLFTPGETGYRGPVLIRAVATRGSSVVRDSIHVQVVDPPEQGS